MDISGEYTKMCFCEEIQGLWKPEPGDWVALYSRDIKLYFEGVFPLGKNIDNGEPVLYVDFVPPDRGEWGYNECEYMDFEDDTKLYIWLPRQDQIQKLLGVESFREFCATPSSSYYIGFDSWEKYWLAFYMDKKHQKIWNGKTWIE